MGELMKDRVFVKDREQCLWRWIQWYVFSWLEFMDSDCSLFYKSRNEGKAVIDLNSWAIQNYMAQILVHYTSN